METASRDPSPEVQGCPPSCVHSTGHGGHWPVQVRGEGTGGLRRRTCRRGPRWTPPAAAEGRSHAQLAPHHPPREAGAGGRGVGHLGSPRGHACPPAGRRDPSARCTCGPAGPSWLTAPSGPGMQREVWMTPGPREEDERPVRGRWASQSPPPADAEEAGCAGPPLRGKGHVSCQW